METLRIGPLEFAETPFLAITGDEWASLVEALEASVLEMSRFAREREGAGRIVVVSSPSAARAIEGGALEGIAGAFLTTVAQVAAVELEPRGITANVIVPGRPPDDTVVGAVADFLTSEQAAGVTGAVVAADRGFSVTKEAGGKPPRSGRG